MREPTWQPSAQAADAAADLHCVVCEWPDAGAKTPSAEGLLRGMALAHKDIFDLPGRAPGLGLHRGRPDPSRQRAAALERLVQAGASHWAALAMAPLACGATGQNPHFARVTHPHDAECAVGGSSSGSAVAVAAGLTDFSLGTDTAGSVRIPAATCGVLGLKTTHGVIDTTGCAPLAPSLDSIGVLARRTEDARLAMRVLAPDLPVVQHQGPWRMKAWLPESALDAQVHAQAQAWLTAHPVEAIDLSDTHRTLSIYAQRVLCYEAGQTHRAALLAGEADAAVQGLGWTGLSMPEAWYRESIAVRGTLLADWVTQVFDNAQVLVLPSLPHGVPDWQVVQVGDPRFDARALLAMHHFMGFVNYLGLPALNLPIGQDARQRPVCVQLVARPYAEHLLLDIAARHACSFVCS